MGFWKNLFARIAPPTAAPADRSSSINSAVVSAGSDTDSFTEKDNRGTRHETMDHASAYWMARMAKQKKAPFVMYRFPAEADARQALLDLPCIHVAENSDKLICTETLIFGYWRADDGKYEAVVCGSDLTHDLWRQAKASFESHGGTRKNDLPPERPAGPPKQQGPPFLGRVAFVREQHQPGQGGIATYRIYKAPDCSYRKGVPR